jgi:hypothetical protein
MTDSRSQNDLFAHPMPPLKKKKKKTKKNGNKKKKKKKNKKQKTKHIKRDHDPFETN